MGYSNEVTIIIQAGTESVNNHIQKEINHVQKLGALDTSEEKWAVFLAEVAVNLETECAWKEITSGTDDDPGVHGYNLKLDKEKRRITINFDDTRWHGGGGERIASFMALFHKVKPYEDYIDAVYLRIGEDLEDMEEEAYGNGYQLARIERSIEID